MAKLLSISDVQEKTACGRKFLLARLNAGDFPQPIQLGVSKHGNGKRAWIEAEIDQWINRHAAARPALTPADHAAEVEA